MTSKQLWLSDFCNAYIAKDKNTMANQQTICPIISTPHTIVTCQREKCELWVEKRNDDFSMCAISLMSVNVGNLSYQEFVNRKSKG